MIIYTIVLTLLILIQIGVFRAEMPDAPRVDNLYGGKYIYLTICGSLAVIICTILYLFRFYKIFSLLSPSVATIQMAIFLSFWSLFFFRRVYLYTSEEMKKMHGGIIGIIRQCPRHLIPFIVISCYLIEIDRPTTKIDYILSLLSSILYCIWVRYTFSKNNKYPYPFLSKFDNPLHMYSLFILFVTIFFIMTSLYNKLLRFFSNKFFNKKIFNKDDNIIFK